MTQVAIRTPAAIAMPRGATWAADFFAALAGAVHTLWAARPHADAALARGREAAALRRYASRMSNTDPAFAADLYAAADRHLEGSAGR